MASDGAPGRAGGSAPAPLADRSSTEPTAVPTVVEERRHRTMRRVALAALSAFVLLGLFGLLGVRSASTSRTAGDLSVTLRRATVARPALAVPYHLTIHRDGGFDEPIEVRISTAYLAAFDENGSHPQPDGASTDGDDTIWEFYPPDGETFTVWLDTRIEPGVQWRRPGTTTVIHGDERVAISHPMWILP